ncbi:hypothetical protein SLS60_008592 [Paraconiothyrium brasiliense]|uniref:Uncharacterized protein n=1 Tax=Paraconiothyrium brasiliense TaxID=300254 RepID=A0ABR3QXW4_9PLEO
MKISNYAALVGLILPFVSSLFTPLKPQSSAVPDPATPQLDLNALTDGSIANVPIQALLLHGLVAEQQQKAAAAASKQWKSEDDDAQEKVDTANGGIAGGVMGSALSGGIMNAHKGPVIALCNALTSGAGTAIGPSVKEEVGGAAEKNATKQTQGDQNHGPEISTGTDQASEPHHIAAAVPGPLLGNFVGATVSTSLSRGICEGAFQKWGMKWVPKIAQEAIGPEMYGEGLEAAQKVLANKRFRTVQQIMQEAGVPVDRAVNFISDLQAEISHLPLQLDGAIASLQSEVVNGASQISDAIAAGRGATIGPALNAVNQVGALSPMCAFAAGGLSRRMLCQQPSSSASPVQQFEALTNQLSQLNRMASSLFPGTQLLREVQPVIGGLQHSASQAVQGGHTLLKGAGSIARNSLSAILDLIAPFHDSKGEVKFTKTHHVTKTHYATQTHEVTRTHHVTKDHQVTETHHVTKTHEVTEIHHGTKTHEITKTHLKTKTTTATETETRTKTKTKTEHVRETDHITRLHTKTASKTVTGTARNPVSKPTAISGPSQLRLTADRDWQSIGIGTGDAINERTIYCYNKNGHFSCYGTVRSPINYHEVKDKKFEKCVQGRQPWDDNSGWGSGGLPFGLATCFSKSMPKGHPSWWISDNGRKRRGVVCAGGDGGQIQCWGTPKHSTVRYKKMTSGELDKCLQSPRKTAC